MAKAGYVATTDADVALTAATAKSVLGVSAPAQFGVDLLGLRVGFGGVTAADEPVLVELCAATFATNAPGTNSTSVTIVQKYGRSITTGFTAARNWTTEPTVLDAIDEWQLTPNGGLVVYDFPLGNTPDSDVSKGFVIRCTAPDALSVVRAALLFERC